MEPLSTILCCLGLIARIAASGDPATVTPVKAIEGDLLAVARLESSARSKLAAGVAGMDEDSAEAGVTGIAGRCCTVNIVRMRERLVSLAKTAGFLERGYAQQGSTAGRTLAAEIAGHVREARQIVEFFAAAPDAGVAVDTLDRLHALTLELNRDKKRLAECCNDLAVPAPED